MEREWKHLGFSKPHLRTGTPSLPLPSLGQMAFQGQETVEGNGYCLLMGDLQNHTTEVLNTQRDGELGPSFNRSVTSMSYIIPIMLLKN